MGSFFLLWSSFFRTTRPLASSEETAYYWPAHGRTDGIPERDQRPRDNGYKFVTMDINSRQKSTNRVNSFIACSAFCPGPTSEICDTCIRVYWNPNKFPIYKVWWLREASQIGQTFIPRGAQHGRIPIDPSILAAIGHRFMAKKKKTKNANAQVWGDMHGDEKPETFLGLN